MTPENLLAAGTVGYNPPPDEPLAPETPVKKPQPATPAARVYAKADEIGVPRDAVNNLIGEESSWNHYDRHGRVKRSSQNARGLMQVVPDSGSMRTVGGKQYNVDDEDQNIEAGLRYFKEGMDKSGGDTRSAALYYFGGPKALRRYQTSGRIPNIKDATGTTASKYVNAVGGNGKPANVSPEDLLAAGTMPSQPIDSSPEAIAAAEKDVAEKQSAMTDVESRLQTAKAQSASATPEDLLAAGTQQPSIPPGPGQPGAAPAEPATGAQLPAAQVAGERPVILTENNRNAITRPRVVTQPTDPSQIPKSDADQLALAAKIIDEEKRRPMATGDASVADRVNARLARLTNSPAMKSTPLPPAGPTTNKLPVATGANEPFYVDESGQVHLEPGANVTQAQAEAIVAQRNAQSDNSTGEVPNSRADLTPGQRAEQSREMGDYNQIDAVNAQVMAKLAAERRAELLQKQQTQKLNGDDFTVRTAVKNPDKLAADISWHFGADAVQQMASLPAAQQRKMILIATAAANRYQQQKAADPNAQPPQGPEYQAKMRARIPGLTASRDQIPATGGMGNFRMAEDKAARDASMSQGNVRMFEGAEQESARQANIVRTELARQGPGLPPLVNRLRDAGVTNPIGVVNRISAASSLNPQISVMATPEQNAAELERSRQANRQLIQSSAQAISENEADNLRAQRPGAVRQVMRALSPAFALSDTGTGKMILGETGPKVLGELTDTFADLMHMADTGAGTIRGNDTVDAALSKIRDFGAYMRGRGEITPKGGLESAAKTGAGFIGAAEKYEILKGATGLPFWAIMGGEAALQTQGQPVSVQATKTAENVLFGAALEFGPKVVSDAFGKLPGPLGELARKMPATIGVATTSTGFGGMAAYQTYKKGGTPAEVIGAGLGAGLGAAALSATAVGSELKAADIPGRILASENAPEFAREIVGKATNKEPAIVFNETGDRAASVWVDRDTGRQIKQEVTPEKAQSLLDRGNRASIVVPDAEFEQKMLRAGSTATAAPPTEEPAGVAPINRQIEAQGGDKSPTVQPEPEAKPQPPVAAESTSKQGEAITYKGQQYQTESLSARDEALIKENGDNPADFVRIAVGSPYTLIDRNHPDITFTGGQSNATETGQQPTDASSEKVSGPRGDQDSNLSVARSVRAGAPMFNRMTIGTEGEQISGPISSDRIEPGAGLGVAGRGSDVERGTGTEAAPGNAATIAQPNARRGAPDEDVLGRPSGAASEVAPMPKNGKPATAEEMETFRAPDGHLVTVPKSSFAESKKIAQEARRREVALEAEGDKGLRSIYAKPDPNRPGKTRIDFNAVDAEREEIAKLNAESNKIRVREEQTALSKVSSAPPAPPVPEGKPVDNEPDSSSLFDSAFAELKAERAPEPPAAPTGTPKQLRAQLAAVDKELKTLRQRREGAYETAINDKGRALDEVQALMKPLEQRRTAIVHAIQAATVGGGTKSAPTARQWTEIGKNSDGKTLYEDQHGVRALSDNGVRITEPVPVRPTRAGVEAVTPVHKGEYQLASEANAPGIADSAKTAATEAVSGLSDMVKGLGELFKSGAKGDINPMGPVFDEETYQKAKPFFITGAQHFYKAGMSFGDAMRALLKYLIDAGKFTLDQIAAMKPYIAHFMDEFRAGKIDLSVDADAHDAAHSPLNEREHPTEGQQRAGNYKKGPVHLSGVRISIENPEGSERSGTDPNGKKWSITMESHYGYIRALRPTVQSFKQPTGANTADLGRASEALPSGNQRVYFAKVVNDLVARIRQLNPSLSENLTQRRASNSERESDRFAANAFTEQLKSFFDVPTEGSGRRVDAVFDQAVSDWRDTATHVFGDLSNANAIGSKGFDSLDIKNQTMVQRSMLAAVDDLQILRGIVQLLPVNVMDMLRASQDASGRLRSDEAVLRNALAIPLDDSVRASVVGVIDSIASRLPVAFASAVAEKEPTLRVRKAVRTDLDRPPASATGKDVHKTYHSTEGADGEHVDAFIKPGTPLDYQGPVFVVNQTKGNGHFDEHKSMIGWDNEADAREAYLANYEKGWDRIGSIAHFADMGEFKDWLKNEDQYLPAKTPDPNGRATAPSAGYGTIDNPNVPNLATWFAARFQRGESYGSITQARKDASELLGGRVEPGTDAAKKIDEAVELGVVKAARQILEDNPRAGAGKVAGELIAYEKLVDLYKDQQPNLGVKTSTSVQNQAYSTPIPLAYVASRLAGITDKTTVYEPTAGNGALLIEANDRAVVANELNPERRANLEALLPDANIHGRDASEWEPNAKQSDVVIANPPFGIVKEEGETKRFQINDRYNTGEIDHAISLKALEAMKDDGSAVLILGGVNSTDPEKRSNGYSGKAKLEFYVTLYGEYNVVDHFTVNGDLYKKQGAAWPVDVIVIHGRGKSSRTLPAADVPRIYDSWDELEGVFDEPYRKSLDASRAIAERSESRPERAPGGRSDQGRARDAAGSADISEASGRPAGSDVEPGGRSREGVARSDRNAGIEDRGDDLQRPGGSGRVLSGDRPVSQRAPASTEHPGPTAAKTAAQQSGSAENLRGDNARGVDERAPESANESGPVARTPRPKEKQDVTLTQSPYRSASQAGVKLNTLVPANMKGAIEGALDRLVDRVGDVDKYVADEVGYDPKELGDYFSAEQIDATALAIDNLKRNSGMIIGDQGGIGKGRVIAAVIKWAHKNDKPVIFVTEKPNLYKDIVRDLTDIGYGSVREWAKRAIMTNSSTTVPLDDEGQFELKTSPASHKAKLQELMNEGDLGHHDLILTTYNQMQTVQGARTHRQDFLEHFAPGSIVIFDESHNAGGAEKKDMRSKAAKALGPQLDRSVFARQLINAADGVFYSSATYAKRPQVMDLYSKTDMKLAVAKPSDLAGAIEKGGVPLQQAVAAMLAEAGQYIRRERDFAGMTYETDPVAVNHAQAESTSAVMRAIVVFDLIKQDAVAGMDKEAKAAAKKIIGSSGATGKAGAESTNFTSLMHNLISQMLLMLKADGAVEQALDVLKNDEKPVITLASTMGSFIQGYAEDNDLHAGDAIGLSFGDMLRRYLERSRDVRVGKAFGPQERHYLSDEELGPAGLAAYNRVLELIRDSNWDGMPVSPIDYIKHRLKTAQRHDGKPGGYSIGEITGRGHVVEYTPRTQIYKTRPARETSIKGRSQTLVDFNNGTHDGLIINQAGSTGLSIHASEKFRDQRKRVMLITQPELNIDTHMQMLYRVDRTGQVVKPGYRQLMADIPAEKRPAAILSKKMASLNANTTAAKGSAYEAKDVPDFMNQYGDEVAASLMEDHPEINKELGRPIKPGKGQGLERDGAVRKLTGRIPLLTEQRQDELYAMIESEYHDLIQRLDAMGENALEAKTLNLDAKLLKKTEVFKGTGDSPFSRGAFAEESDVKRIGKPYTSEQVTRLLSDAVKGAEGDGLAELRFKGRDVSRSQAADTQSRFADYKRGIVDAEEDPDKAKAQEIKLDEQLNRWRDLHQALQLGTSVKMDTPLGEVYGIVVKVEQKGKPRNPVTPGSWRATFAVADAMRQVTVPFSKIKLPDDAKTAEESMGSSSKYRVAPAQEAMVRDKEQGRKISVPIIKAFDLKQSESREQRVILTGNLLAAFGRFKKGRIINFTDTEGQVRQGIMMPVDFNLEKAIKEEPAIFKRARDIMDFLREAPNSRLVTTPDSVLRLSYNHGSLLVETSASKARGGQYYLNEQILDAANDEFVKSGNNMRMFVGEDRATDVVNAILSQGTELQTDSFKDEAKKLLGRPDVNADRGQRGSVGVAPARTGYEGPGPGAKLSDLSQRIRDAFNVIRGRGPTTPAQQSFSTMGRLRHIWMSGGGLGQTERFNAPVNEAARKVAGASTTADLHMRRGMQAVQQIMKTKGGWLKFLEARYHALLQGPHGKKDMWLDQRDMALHLPDEEFYDFYAGGDNFDGVRSLVQIIEGMPFGADYKAATGMDPKDSVTGMVDSLLAADDTTAARAYLADLFEAAANDVVSIMDPKEYEHLVSSKEFQEANPVFDRLISDPMAASHAENEGIFSEYTGPFGYMPLQALDPKGGLLHRIASAAKRGREFQKPKNIRNRFATGLSPFGYDVSPEALAGAIRKSERVNTVANLIRVGKEEGLFKRIKRGEKPPDTVEYNGESFVAKTVPEGVDRIILKDSKEIHVAAPRMAVPDFLYKELLPMLEEGDYSRGKFVKLMAAVNRFAMMGVIMPAMHIRNIQSALIAGTPYIGTGVASKTIGNLPFTKWLNVWAHLLAVDPWSHESIEKIYEMSEMGVMPSHYAKMVSGLTYKGRQFAGQTGAEKKYLSLGPLIYGPGGIDVRARLMMYDAAKSFAPNASKTEIAKFIDQLGNYNHMLHGAVEKFLKKYGIDPFYTAANTYWSNAIKATFGVTPLPTKGDSVGRRIVMRLAQLLSGGVVGMVILWTALYKAYTGKYPWQDPRAKLLSIPLSDKDRQHWLAQKVYGKGAGTAYVGMAFFSPLIERGMRATGIGPYFDAHQEGATKGQASEKAAVSILNSGAHQFVGGPMPSAATGLVFGKRPFLTGVRDFTGREGPSFLPATKTAEPGLPTWKAHALAAATGLNSFVESAAERTGVTEKPFGKPKDKETAPNPWLRMAVDIAFPRLLQGPVDLDKQRAGFVKGEKAIETDIRRDEGLPNPRARTGGAPRGAGGPKGPGRK